MSRLKGSPGGQNVQAANVTLVAGAATVLGVYLNTTSEIQLQRKTEGAGGPDFVSVQNRVNGNPGQFDIISNNVLDDGNIEFLILSDLEGLT